MKSNTKNAKGSGTIRKRSDGRWEARYTTGIDPKTGKQTQKSVYGKTQKEVRQKLTEVTAEIDAGTYQMHCAHMDRQLLIFVNMPVVRLRSAMHRPVVWHTL